MSTTAGAGHAASDPPGGDVNIDALKKLLAYAESDPTGILRRTLESLSVFSYESLSGDIRVGPQGGRGSLSLGGKKRFGSFPGPAPAIHPWPALVVPAPAEAQVPDLKVRTPEVMASIESRRARFPQIQQWKGR